jgi:putative oxidoreductase
MTTNAQAARPVAIKATADVAVLAAAGRFLMAAIFLLSGYSKIADPASTIGYIQSVGLPFPQLAFAGALIAEIAGGILLVVGFRTRIVASVLAVFSILTAVFFHAALGDQNQFIHFFKNIAITGGLLQIVAFGAGRVSIDARIAKTA